MYIYIYIYGKIHTKNILWADLKWGNSGQERSEGCYCRCQNRYRASLTNKIQKMTTQKTPMMSINLRPSGEKAQHQDWSRSLQSVIGKTIDNQSNKGIYTYNLNNALFLHISQSHYNFDLNSAKMLIYIHNKSLIRSFEVL